MRPEPLLNGDSDTQRAPTLLILVARMRDEAMLVVERQLDLGHQIAALIIAEKGFRPRRGEFHRPADLFRGPQHQTEFDKGAVAGAEIAADVGEITRRFSGAMPSTWISSFFCRTAPPEPA